MSKSFVRFPLGFRVHKAWIMVIGCALFSMGTLAVIFGANGAFYVAICNDMGFSRGDISAWQQVHFLVAIPCMPIAVKLLERFGSRVVCTVTGASCAVAAALMGTYTEVWQWSISAVLYGSLGVLGTMELACPIIIGNWFAKRAGFAIGAMGAICALSTSIISPLFTILIDMVGWRSAYFIQTGVIGLLCIPFSLFVSHLRPSDVGALPYGCDSSCGDGSEGNERVSDSGGISWRMVVSFPFVMLFLFAGVSSFIASGFDAHLVGFATSEGHTAFFGSLLGLPSILEVVFRNLLWVGLATGWAFKKRPVSPFSL